ncbi:hypothetical protein GCK32_013726, partial [Trichostrongylus colubriformis]
MDISAEDTSRKLRSSPDYLSFRALTPNSVVVDFPLVAGDAERDEIEGYEFRLFDTFDMNKLKMHEKIPLAKLMVQNGSGVVHAYGLHP